jgi:acyl-CoA thioesterase FadM
LLTLEQRIIRDGVVLLTATVLVVTIKDGKPSRLPPDIAKLFNPANS